MTMNHIEQVAADVLPSLEEDIGSGDITAALIAADQHATATVVAREPAVVCGIPWFNAVYRHLDATLDMQWQVEEGSAVVANQHLLTLSGPARAVLVGERSALNWLQCLSGTATTVSHCVKAIEGTKTELLDTRKTIPGLRYAQKYAVRIGGARNHRMGLYDAYLIKENHIAACGSISQAVERARSLSTGQWIEVEVETMVELEEALRAHVDFIMLDNFDYPSLREAVRLSRGRAKLEASGNLSYDTLRRVAETGVDYISMGCLTKDIRSIDFSMQVLPARAG